MTDHGEMSPLVGTSTSAPAVATLAAPAVAHREAFRAYVLAEAEPWHQDHLGRLYELWEDWNRAHFAAAMVAPYILLNEPPEPRVYGCCGRVSGFGGRSEIRLRPSLLTGSHPHMRAGDAYAAGRFLFIADVLIHEMIHQWQQEVTGATEPHYSGHGHGFAGMCNRIGAALGLAPVRIAKRSHARKHERDRPLCGQWPHIVRPTDFYLDAYAPVARGVDLSETYVVPAEPGALGDALARLLTPADALIVAGALVRCFGFDPATLAPVPASGDTHPRS